MERVYSEFVLLEFAIYGIVGPIEILLTLVEKTPNTNSVRRCKLINLRRKYAQPKTLNVSLV